jgi:hypothetical protein
MGRSDVYVKLHQLSDAELIKLLQFQGDDDGEADSLSVIVEEEIARPWLRLALDQDWVNNVFGSCRPGG